MKCHMEVEYIISYQMLFKVSRPGVHLKVVKVPLRMQVRRTASLLHLAVTPLRVLHNHLSVSIHWPGSFINTIRFSYLFLCSTRIKLCW